MMKKIVFAVFFLASSVFVINNFYFLSRDMILGDSSGERTHPQPLLGFERVDDTKIAKKYSAENRIAGDFAQVYFPSQDFSNLTKNYQKGYLDPWKRPSRYAPLIHYLCSVTICKLDYGPASFLHMLIQILLFFSLSILSFRILGIQENIWAGVLLSGLILFATPSGLQWYERGQFTLYVALSYLLLILGLIKKKPILVIASACFAYIKWTSFPYLCVVFIIYLLSIKNLKEGVKPIIIALTYILIILLFSLMFRSRFVHFLNGLFMQEITAIPKGISLALVFPQYLVKVLPIILILLGYLSLRRFNHNFNNLIPFLIGSGILLLLYPTLAHVYTVPTLLCFVPIVFYWTKKNDLICKIIRNSFFLFLILISFINYSNHAIDIRLILYGYVVFSMVFILTPLIRPQWFSSHYDLPN